MNEVLNIRPIKDDKQFFFKSPIFQNNFTTGFISCAKHFRPFHLADNFFSLSLATPHGGLIPKTHTTNYFTHSSIQYHIKITSQLFCHVITQIIKRTVSARLHFFLANFPLLNSKQSILPFDLFFSINRTSSPWKKRKEKKALPNFFTWAYNAFNWFTLLIRCCSILLKDNSLPARLNSVIIHNYHFNRAKTNNAESGRMKRVLKL